MYVRWLLPFALLIPACIGPAPAPAAGSARAAAPAASAPANASSRSVALPPPPPVVAASEAIPGFMHGINLGDALDAPTEGAWGVHLSETHFEMAKAAGLDHVRLPVRFSAHADQAAPYTIEEEFFKRVDWAVDQATSRGLAVIVDLHHYEELMKDPDANADRFVALWTQIAARYKDRPASLAFELTNEPCDKLTPTRLNPLHARVLKAVRASNPTRTIFEDGYFWASAEWLKRLELPEDPNIVASFHMYQPILLTHQGAPWMPPEYGTQGLIFPGPPTRPVEPVVAARRVGWINDWFHGYNSQPPETNPGGPKAVYEVFKLVEDYIADSHRRVYMGEFGIMDSADPESRVVWLGLVRKEAERRNIGWAYWDDGGKFKGMDVAHRSWVPSVKRGLFE